LFAASRPVSTQPDRHTCRAFFDHWGKTPLASIMLLERIVHASHLPLGQDLAVRFVRPKMQCGRDYVRPENTELVEILHRCRAVLRAAVVQFFFILRRG